MPRFVVAGLHRNVSLLVVVFVGVHIATAVLDPYAGIRLIDAVVPFASSYRPVWVGLGALAVDLLAAVIVTSLVRVRLGLRAWRAVHWAVYVIWPVAVVHALGSGSDVRSRNPAGGRRGVHRAGAGGRRLEGGHRRHPGAGNAGRGRPPVSA